MKCFRHPDTNAVGLCKKCSKGLCCDCAADLGHGLACKGTCQRAVLLVQKEDLTRSVGLIIAQSIASGLMLYLLFLTEGFTFKAFLFTGALFCAFGALGSARHAVKLLQLSNLYDKEKDKQANLSINAHEGAKDALDHDFEEMEKRASENTL